MDAVKAQLVKDVAALQAKVAADQAALSALSARVEVFEKKAAEEAAKAARRPFALAMKAPAPKQD